MINWRLEVFEELASTSDYCMTAARNGEPEGFAVLAWRQTAGRGSRGRQWQAPEGNLNLSVLLRPARPASRAGVLALLLGVAVAEALVALPAPTLQLKWPNDILIGDAKLGGVLIDAAPEGGRLDWLVAGMGINLAAAPEITGRKTTSLAAHGIHVPPKALAEAILSRLDVWADAQDEAIRTAWLSRAHPLGTPMTVRSMNGTLMGTFAGLSPIGELLLQCQDDRMESISTGEILLGAR